MQWRGQIDVRRKLLPEYGIARFLNADEIARGLSPFDPTAAALKAGRLLLDEARARIAAGTSFALESTLSGKGPARLLESAKAGGFRVTLHYVSIESPEQAGERVRLRVKPGGHHVPATDIERRFPRSRELPPDPYLPLADEWTMWNNTFPPPREIANFENCNRRRLRDMIEASESMETADTGQPDIFKKGLKAGRKATEEMLEYYRRMGVVVTPQMTLANPDEELNIPRGVL